MLLLGAPPCNSMTLEAMWNKEAFIYQDQTVALQINMIIDYSNGIENVIFVMISIKPLYKPLHNINPSRHVPSENSTLINVMRYYREPDQI